MGGGLQIRFVERSKTVYAKKIIGDVYINFVEYCWSKDSARVGLFIANMPAEGFAYDFARRTEIPFESMKEAVAEKIRGEYQLTSTQDPFSCLKCMQDFTKEHPSETTH